MPRAGSSSRTRTTYSRHVSSFREKLNSRILRPAGGGGQGSWASWGPPPMLLPLHPGYPELAAPEGQRVPTLLPPWAGWVGSGEHTCGMGLRGVTSAPQEGSEWPSSCREDCRQRLQKDRATLRGQESPRGKAGGPQGRRLSWCPRCHGPTQGPAGPHRFQPHLLLGGKWHEAEMRGTAHGPCAYRPPT